MKNIYEPLVFVYSGFNQRVDENLIFNCRKRIPFKYGIHGTETVQYTFEYGGVEYCIIQTDGVNGIHYSLKQKILNTNGTWFYIHTNIPENEIEMLFEMFQNPEIDDAQIFLYFELNLRNDLDVELQEYTKIEKSL